MWKFMESMYSFMTNIVHFLCVKKNVKIHVSG